MKTLFFFFLGTLIGYILGRIQTHRTKKTQSANNDFQVTDEMIVRFANLRKGIISASELASQTSLSSEEAQKRLEKLVSMQIAELRVSETGQILYDFTKNQPDLLEKIKSEKI
ncbi:hypothetical protein [Raineya sp.]|jgi:Fic family protein